MRDKIIAWDLGTSGNKASLYDRDGTCIAEETVPYETIFTSEGFFEQRPADWWKAVVKSTRALMEKSGTDKEDILCCSSSGHSICVIPLDKDGKLVIDQVPIWADARAVEESKAFFEHFGRDNWYLRTGAGVKPSEYPVFKLCWYRNHYPEVFARFDKILGTTDYINYLLTGRITSGRANACGTAVYNLKTCDYDDDILDASGLSRDMFPDIVEETDVVGQITKDAACELGLSEKTLVVAGGPDTVCMPVGARAAFRGRAYISLGTSCWLGWTGDEPVLDLSCTPYIFPLEGLFASAISMASGGSAYKWVRDVLCAELAYQAESEHRDMYELMAELVEKAPVGANGLIFNNCLAGGMPFDPGANMRGGFLGLQLRHTKADILRASLEGITFKLREIKEHLEKSAKIEDGILLVGGGGQNSAWRKIIADCLHCTVLKSSIDAQAGALGAAAYAAVGTGLWSGFERIDDLHVILDKVSPDKERGALYDELYKIYIMGNEYMAHIGDALKKLGM